jgi:hypothetical protein
LYGGGGAGNGTSPNIPLNAGVAGNAGVVILSIPSVAYPGTATGATVTTPAAAAGQTILTYTAPPAGATYTYTA